MNESLFTQGPLQIRGMSSDEINSYLANKLDEDTKWRSRCRDVTLEKAKEQVENEWNLLMPMGPHESLGHSFLAFQAHGEEEVELIVFGGAWLQLSLGQEGLLHGFDILPAHRGKGIGKIALEALHAFARLHLDIRLIRCRCYGANDKSVNLMASVGYRVSEVNMLKVL